MTARKVGPWTVDASYTAYSNPWIEVVDHAVRHPDGSPGQYGVVRFRNRAIGVLPLGSDGVTYLVGQHRFPLDAYSWELPEGGGALGEDPLEAARRELKEETGLTARVFLPLLECDLSNSVTDERAVCFLAWDLAAGDAAPEPSEALCVRRIAFRDLLADVLAGRVRDSLTVMMALGAEVKALRGELPRDVSRAILGTDL